MYPKGDELLPDYDLNVKITSLVDPNCVGDVCSDDGDGDYSNRDVVTQRWQTAYQWKQRTKPPVLSCLISSSCVPPSKKPDIHRYDWQRPCHDSHLGRGQKAAHIRKYLAFLAVAFWEGPAKRPHMVSYLQAPGLSSGL